MCQYKRANNKSNHIFEKALRIVHQKKHLLKGSKDNSITAHQRNINFSYLNCKESILGLPATFEMERFVIIVNGFQLPAVNYYHKALHLGCCSSPRSASDYTTSRSRLSQIFYLIDVLKNFVKLTGNHLCCSLFFKKPY